MNKDRKVDWQDTNMALFGSDIEKKCKAAAADGEPQWVGAGVKVGIQIWRIEQFKVRPWPKNKYGKFHRGDSYIILNTYVKNPEVNPDKLAFDVHFWIGESSTQDEYGTAAYKTVELDDKLGGEPVQHREVQENESKLFLGYFSGGLTYLDGGAESGFRKVEKEAYEVRLLQIKGGAGNVALKEVALSRASMNSGDVFILDTEEAIWQWNGSGSNAHERSQAALFCAAMRGDRGGTPKVTVMTEGVDDEESGAPGFWVHLPGERRFLGLKVADIVIRTAEKGGEDTSVAAFRPTVYRLRVRASGQPSVSRVARGAKSATDKKPSRSVLKGDGLFLLDTGFECTLWVGRAAPTPLKASAFPFAQHYLKAYKRPAVLPIHRHGEGKEPDSFLAYFGPEEEAGCACVVS